MVEPQGAENVAEEFEQDDFVVIHHCSQLINSSPMPRSAALHSTELA